jgi:hypothetical protein
MHSTINISSYLFSIIIINLYVPIVAQAQHRAFLWISQKRTGHHPPRGHDADWWVLRTANAANSND